MSSEAAYREFTGYEYKEVEADNSRVSFLIDGYENFGWEIDENAVYANQQSRPGSHAGPAARKTVIYMKRSRKIINKAAEKL